MAAFVTVSTQWRTVWVGGLEGGRLMRTGLDYQGARAGLEMAGVKVDADLFDGLRVMERAAIEAWASEA